MATTAWLLAAGRVCLLVIRLVVPSCC
jgi:hypothetical protein